METTSERRASRRFTMALPITIHEAGAERAERQGQTRDVSFRGLYFLSGENFEVGSKIEFVLTLPKEITLATDVQIRCSGHVVRVEQQTEKAGVAARIEKYEFLPQD
ncbi:MAG TPA: PilZ domain-containing protein [Candidatus Acidoferrales bacterium]|nr:PilZ domain-containing protein [Candidatus Acidoferrales bacterium]